MAVLLYVQATDLGSAAATIHYLTQNQLESSEIVNGESYCHLATIYLNIFLFFILLQRCHGGIDIDTAVPRGFCLLCSTDRRVWKEECIPDAEDLQDKLLVLFKTNGEVLEIPFEL